MYATITTVIMDRDLLAQRKFTRNMECREQLDHMCLMIMVPFWKSRHCGDGGGGGHF
jgi:hypothetical protein